jgi:hypothetical protein
MKENRGLALLLPVKATAFAQHRPEKNQWDNYIT